MATQDRPRRMRVWLAIGGALALALGTSATVSAGKGAVVVHGVQRAYGTCGELHDGYEMRGDLEGCWWITSFVSKSAEGKHNLLATGTEHFEGWLGGQWGTFETTYTFTAKFDGAWESGAAELHGRCHHPVIEGTGVFEGVHGELSFRDVLDGPDAPNYPYWGSLQLGSGVTVTLGATSARRADGGSGTSLTC